MQLLPWLDLILRQEVGMRKNLKTHLEENNRRTLFLPTVIKHNDIYFVCEKCLRVHPGEQSAGFSRVYTRAQWKRWLHRVINHCGINQSYQQGSVKEWTWLQVAHNAGYSRRQTRSCWVTTDPTPPLWDINEPVKLGVLLFKMHFKGLGNRSQPAQVYRTALYSMQI